MFIHNSFQIIYKCEFVWSISCYFLFWDSYSNHCLAALDLGAGVEKPFGCLIVQNRQVMQSIRRSMDWTLEDNRVDGLFFCATLTGRRGSHAHLYKQERKRPTPVWRRSSRFVRPLRRTYVVVVKWTDEMLCGGYKWVSRFEAPYICSRWTCERWVEQMSRLHGTTR